MRAILVVVALLTDLYNFTASCIYSSLNESCCFCQTLIYFVVTEAYNVKPYHWHIVLCMKPDILGCIIKLVFPVDRMKGSDRWIKSIIIIIIPDILQSITYVYNLFV